MYGMWFGFFRDDRWFRTMDIRVDVYMYSGEMLFVGSLGKYQ